MPSQQSSSTTQKAEQKAGQMVDKAEQQASQLTDKAKQQATSQAESRKDQVAQEVSAVADATRKASEQLRKQQHETVAHYADMAAQRLDGFSQSLRQRDMNELMSEAERMARQRPGLFVGGAFALGFLATRFLKSSSPEQGSGTSGQASGQYPYGYSTPTYASGNPRAETAGVPGYPPADTTTYSPYAQGREG